MKTKKTLILITISLVIALIAPAYASHVNAESSNVAGNQEAVTFPIAFQRATKDPINAITTDNKGTILTISDKYLNITRNNGQTWEARALPSSKVYYGLRYVSGVYYLSNAYSFAGESHYFSTDAVNWTPFSLEAPEGIKLGIENIQVVNGTRILIGTSEKLNKAYVFTSDDGFNWVQKGVIDDILWTGSQILIVWNGKGYSAIAGGHKYYDYKQTNQMNHFLIKSDEGAELIVYTSSDLVDWKLRSGTVNKKLLYTWNTTDAEGNFVPERNYYVYEEQPIANGVIRLFDIYSNQLTSTDGVTFKFKKSAPIFQKYSLADDRTPILQQNNKYYVFTQFWHAPGVLRTRMLTSTDKVNWKETKIKALDNMYVIKSGKFFIGYNEKEVVISSDGLNWKKIK